MVLSERETMEVVKNSALLEPPQRLFNNPDWVLTLSQGLIQTFFKSVLIITDFCLPLLGRGFFDKSFVTAGKYRLLSLMTSENDFSLLLSHGLSSQNMLNCLLNFCK